MSAILQKVVFDCNVFAQSLLNSNGPAAACLMRAQSGEVVLLISAYVLQEVRELHLKIPPRFNITAEQTNALARTLESFALIVADVEERYIHPIDPDDSHYINLAVQMNAQLVVSRDRHLLQLMNPARKEAVEFQALFPSLRILDPVEFLKTLSAPTE